MVADLTGLPISNASLLDDATAAAEAFKMAHTHCREKRTKFFVASDCHPQVIGCVQMRAKLQGVEVVVGDPATTDFSTKEYSGCLVQYPNTYGTLRDFKSVSDNVHKSGGLFIAASGTSSSGPFTPRSPRPHRRQAPQRVRRRCLYRFHPEIR